MGVFILEIRSLRLKELKEEEVSIKCWAVCKIQKSHEIYVIMLITVDINSTGQKIDF